MKIKLRRFRITSPLRQKETSLSSMVETMLRRVSCRTYFREPLEADMKQEILGYLNTYVQGPFGNAIRFRLVDFSEHMAEQIKSLGTYGVIKDASLFIAGSVRNQIHALEDFGYCMEKVILAVTRMGLGTCWLGASFRRKAFEKTMGVSEGELVPAVTPVGYAAEKKSFTESMVRVIAGSDARKPWTKLFFEDDFFSPLQRENCGMYQVPLEMVRIAPSASNRQPWRIQKERGKDHFHFYLRKSRGYDPFGQAIPFQYVDIGIAMCHFELAAREIGLGGRWRKRKDRQDTEDLEYIISWTG